MQAEITRLKWACRRGMLELDVILGNFLKEGYPHLSLLDQQLFIDLLETPDPELYDYLMGRSQPSDPNLASITEFIRQHAQSRI